MKNQRKKREDKRKILGGLFLFCAAVILSACGKEERKEILEKIFGAEYLQVQEIRMPVQTVCNSDSVWVITAVKDAPIYKWSMQTPGIEPEQIAWQSEDGKYDLISIAQRQGTLYAELRNREDNALEIRKNHAGEKWDIVMSIKAENWEDYAVMGSVFGVDSKENVYLVSGNEMTCFAKEGEKAGVYKVRGNVCSFLESDDGMTECVTADEKEIVLYELKEGRAEEKWTWKQEENVGKGYGIGCSEEETACLATDRELLFFDRVSGGLLARADLVKSGVSSVCAGYYDGTEGTLQLFGTVGNGEGLSYSLLRERDASEEQRTELVYGMECGVNNTENSSIWRAIAEFNQTSQDYYVTIKNYDNHIERLHADMAAGNGPDIIDMTHSEYYESYAKNGYLEDLSPYLEQSQYKDDIIWNILDVYRIDGGLYLFAPQVILKGVAIHPEYEPAVEEWNMETFLNLVEQNGWEKQVIGGQPGDSEALLLFLLNASQEELIDWEQGKAFFETEEFVDMLELCREYAQADYPDTTGWSREEQNYNTLCQVVWLGGDFAMYVRNTDVYGREYPIYGCPSLSGQTYEIISCSDSCAIYSGSGQKEGAWAFIESLLLESNQKYSGITDPGFPVRRSVLNELAEESKSIKVKSGEELLTITDEEIALLKDIFYNGKLCSGMLDPDIQSVIMEEAAAYFAGDKDAKDVAHIIQSRVGLILQE